MDNSQGLSVSNLSDFPFENFKDFVQAASSNEISLAINQSLALHWGLDSLKSPQRHKKEINLMGNLSDIIPCIIIVTFAFITKSWLALLLIPVFKVTQLIFIALCNSPSFLLTGVFLALGFNINWLGILFSSILVNWLFIDTAYRESVRNLSDVCVKDENTLCFLWMNRQMAIDLKDGTRIRSISKEEKKVG